MKHNIACFQIPPEKSVASNPEFIKQTPYAEPLVKILDKSRFIGHSNTDQFKEKVNTALQKLVRGDVKNVDQVLVTMEEGLNGIIKK